jgi:hypothetical protein
LLTVVLGYLVCLAGRGDSELALLDAISDSPDACTEVDGRILEILCAVVMSRHNVEPFTVLVLDEEVGDAGTKTHEVATDGAILSFEANSLERFLGDVDCRHFGRFG